MPPNEHGFVLLPCSDFISSTYFLAVA